MTMLPAALQYGWGGVRFPFSQVSISRLETCDIKLQQVVWLAGDYMDIYVLEGHRPPETQLIYFQEGKSKVKFGKHNLDPSQAVDLAPYPVTWPSSVTRPASIVKDTARFYLLGGLIIGIGEALGIPIRWGGNWNRDGKVYDNRFDDLPHFELFKG